MKDLGAKCLHCCVLRYGELVGFTKMDSVEIPRIKKLAFAPSAKSS